MAIETILPATGAVVALVAVVVGMLGIYDGGTTVLARIRSARTEPQRPREITRGGYVEVVAPIDDMNTEPIAAPFSGADCAAYEYRLRQHDGTTWQVAEGGNSTDFVVEDDTGASVEVHPAGASPTAEWETVATPGAGEELPEESRAALREHPDIDTDARPEFFAEKIDSDREYQERRLEVGEEVYAYGKATSDGVYSARVDADQSSQFAIGTEPAGSFGGSYLSAFARCLFGILFVVGGLYGGAIALSALGVDVPVLGGGLPFLALTAATVGTGVSSVATVGGVGTASLPGVGPGWLSLPLASPTIGFPTGLFDPVVLSLTTEQLVVMVVLGVLVALPGVYTAWRGLSGLLTAARILINQPVDPGAAAMLDGIVELEGTVRPTDEGAVESPYGGDDAVISEFRVREEEKERVRTRDSDGNRKTETRRTWNTTASGSFERNFLVESDGSTIEVDPSGAETTLGGYDTIEQRGGSSQLPQATRLRLSAGDRRGISDPSSFLSQHTSDKQRFQERNLAVGDSIHLYGGAVVDASAPQPTVVEGSDEYSIAAGTELRTVLRRSGGSVLWVLLSLPFLAIGGFMLYTALLILL